MTREIREARRPVIAGAAQTVQRVDDPREALAPLDLMEQALRRAAEDAGAPKLLESLDAVYVPRGLWRHGDPAAEIAERVGASRVETALGAISGHIVQLLVDRACAEIAAGRRDVVAIVGGESEHSRRRLARQGLEPTWKEDARGRPDHFVGSMEEGLFAHEVDAGIRDAATCFSLAETSLRAALGRTPAAHRQALGALQARMSEVAVRNPFAWIPTARSAEEISTPTPGNRMVSYPYTKLMTSNIAVDQGAALLICSQEAATRYGVDGDGLVHLRAATEWSRVSHLSEREVLHRHPGMERSAARVLELAGIGPADLDPVDLYSCFPLSIQAGAAAVGLPLEPVPTVTGGMTFAGGPFANYVLQSTAALVERLRTDPGALGLIGSVGGFFTKFAFGVYSTEPAAAPAPAIVDVGEETPPLPVHPHLARHEGPATIEAYTVAVEPSGPLRATFTAITPSGERVWGRSEDPRILEALLADEEACGRPARLRGGLVELD